jgi:hypothetical protein
MHGTRYFHALPDHDNCSADHSSHDNTGSDDYSTTRDHDHGPSNAANDTLIGQGSS